ncbi:MAG: carbohydrate binding family 9 domain-containing protein [Ignavibacteria bacterium]|nr:carbohydrate binding family 9 domain-containing protein [Ignavibacteria bacterium]
MKHFYIYFLSICCLIYTISFSQNKTTEIIISVSDTTKTLTPSDSTAIKDTSSVSFVPNENPEVTITRIPNEKIVIDGELNEEEWKNAVKITNFCEVDPGDNVKPPVNTDVLICYDEDNLYFGFICYEDNVNEIRKTLTRRDAMYSDDFADVLIDTYGEGKQAYEFVVNPLGIQGDLLWTNPGNEDDSYDAVWYSEAKIEKDRWTAEFAIPFKSIRFPDKNINNWKIHFIRNRPRENRRQFSWAAISRDAPTLFTKSGTLKGIENVKSGKNLEILPSFVSSQSGSISDYSNANSGFVNDKIKGDFGLNVKYGISSTLTSDITYNPDFSQIEADAGIINVNNPYAYFYTEKRPFFIEGANIFSTAFNVVYTRTINNPLIASKLTGKIGKFDVGYLVAYDRKTPFIIPFEYNSDYLNTDRKSLSNILRMKYTIKDETYLGFIFTDREVNKQGNDFLNIDGYNRVFGFDGNFKLGENYFLDFQTLYYASKEITEPAYNKTGTFYNGKYTKALDGEIFSGFGTHLKLLRSAKHLNFELSYNDASPEARRDNGYISYNNYRALSLWSGYMFYPETDFLKRIQLSSYSLVRHTYNGNLRELFFQPEIYLRLKHQLSASAGLYLINNEKFNDVYHKGARRFYLNFNASTFSFLRGGFYATMGKYIIRSQNSFVGYGGEFDFWFTITPLENLILSPEYIYFELSNNYGGEKLFAGYILRNTVNYQILKDLSLRIITEYSSADKYFYVNPLVSYRPNPFTIFYFGITHQYDNLNLLPSDPNYYRNTSKYVLSNRQFFLKCQYLFRL